MRHFLVLNYSVNITIREEHLCLTILQLYDLHFGNIQFSLSVAEILRFEVTLLRKIHRHIVSASMSTNFFVLKLANK